MSGDERPTSRNVYVAVLRKEDGSPLAPESDEEKTKNAEAEVRRTAKNSEARIQNSESISAGIDQRILALPIPARDYSHWTPARPGFCS